VDRIVRVVLVVCAWMFVLAAPAHAQTRDLDCADFSSQSAAQDELNRAPGDPNRLDPDGDGVACELGLPSTSQLASYVLAGAVLVGGVSSALYLRQRRRSSGRSEQDLERRVAGLSSNLQEAARVVGEIENEVQARQSLLDRLKEDAERAEALSRLHASEVEAVAQALRGQLAALERRSFRSNILLSSVFYILGTISGIIINIFVP